MILIVGSTGALGTEVARRLRAAGRRVRALVRADSDPAKVSPLAERGAEMVVGDLKQPDTLAAACAGVEVVISTASSTLSRREGDTLASVDRDGQLALVEAAEAAGVRQLVLVSFPPAVPDHPLQQAKRAVEERVRASPVAATILQPTYFAESWLGPALGIDHAAGKARILGTGHARLSFIALDDVAAFVVAAVGNEAAYDRTFPLGGPDAVSVREVVAMFEQARGRAFELEVVPEEALEAQARAEHPLERSFGCMMLAAARGQVIDTSDALAVMPIEQTPIADWVRRVIAAS